MEQIPNIFACFSGIVIISIAGYMYGIACDEKQCDQTYVSESKMFGAIGITAIVISLLACSIAEWRYRVESRYEREHNNPDIIVI